MGQRIVRGATHYASCLVNHVIIHKFSNMVNGSLLRKIEAIPANVKASIVNFRRNIKNKNAELVEVLSSECGWFDIAHHQIFITKQNQARFR